MKTFYKAITIIALSGAPLAARADLLGDTLSVERGPSPLNETGPVFGGGTKFVAPGGIAHYGPLFDFVVTGDQIIFTAFQSGQIEDQGNQWQFDDLSRDPMFTGVSLDPSSTITFGSALLLNSPSVLVDFPGAIPLQSGQQAIFDLTFAGETSLAPEPASLVLLGTGLLGGCAGFLRQLRP